jgi:hypothetical protein
MVTDLSQSDTDCRLSVRSNLGPVVSATNFAGIGRPLLADHRHQKSRLTGVDVEPLGSAFSIKIDGLVEANNAFITPGERNHRRGLTQRQVSPTSSAKAEYAITKLHQGALT